MPDPNPTWADKKAQLYEIVNRLENLEAQVNAEVRTELGKIKQLVVQVAASEPGERNIGPGGSPGRPGPL